MRLLVPMSLANRSKLKSSVPALTNAARHRSISGSFFFRDFSFRGNLVSSLYHMVHSICTTWYSIASGAEHESARYPSLVCFGSGHLDPRYRLLRLCRSCIVGNNQRALLDQLHSLAGLVGSALLRDPAMAQYPPGRLGVGHTAVGHSGDDWRSG